MSGSSRTAPSRSSSKTLTAQRKTLGLLPHTRSVCCTAVADGCVCMAWVVWVGGWCSEWWTGQEEKNASPLAHSSLVVFHRHPTHPPHPHQKRPSHPKPAPSRHGRPTTFNDLPDDLLHEIFGHVFDEGKEFQVRATDPPQGTHLVLRSVCRRWRGMADWARLASGDVQVVASKLADVDTARLYQPTAITSLDVWTRLKVSAWRTDVSHSPITPQAVASLIGRHPDLRRSLSKLMVTVCCPPLLLRVLPQITACPGLTELILGYFGHKRQRARPPTNPGMRRL